MTSDDKPREHLGSKDAPAEPISNPPQIFAPGVTSPYTSAMSDEDAIARILRASAPPSTITPPNHAEFGHQSDHITWRDRLKGLWMAAGILVMAQNSQAEPPQPTPITQSEVDLQSSSHAATKMDYKYSATPLQDPLSAPKFNFVPASSWLNTGQVFDQQPEQIVQIVVHAQTEKPSETEVQDATDYLRGFQHELHKKVLDPAQLADKTIEGGEAMLGIALFKARKKIRANTQNRLVIWLCDTFDRIAKAFEESQDQEGDDKESPPLPKKRQIGFLADRIRCSSEDTVAVLKLTPCAETEPGHWEYRPSS